MVEIGVGDDPIEPAVENLLVRMGFAIAPLGVLGDRDVDVCSFTKSVLRGIDTTDLDVELVAFVAATNDDRLVGESSERFEDFFA